jgi:hypothetical protein
MMLPRMGNVSARAPPCVQDRKEFGMTFKEDLTKLVQEAKSANEEQVRAAQAFEVAWKRLMEGMLWDNVNIAVNVLKEVANIRAKPGIERGLVILEADWQGGERYKHKLTFKPDADKFQVTSNSSSTDPKEMSYSVEGFPDLGAPALTEKEAQDRVSKFVYQVALVSAIKS